MNLLNTTKPYRKLGFEKLEVAEIVSRLNISLCTYQVFYHKAQNFHWNVVGSDFFDVHELTEELYRQSVVDIDRIAERIRVFGEIPKYRMSDYLRDSIISETSHDKSAEFMIKDLVGDIQKLIETVLDVHDYATRNGDVSSARLAEDLIARLEIYHWKLSAWMNKRYNK